MTRNGERGSGGLSKHYWLRSLARRATTGGSLTGLHAELGNGDALGGSGFSGPKLIRLQLSISEFRRIRTGLPLLAGLWRCGVADRDRVSLQVCWGSRERC
jgi:hypothetical protein